MPRWQSWTEDLRQSWPLLLAGVVLLLGQWLWPGWLAMLLSVVSLFVAGAVQLYRQRQAMRETLAEHPKAFTSALVALTYTDRRGAQALLDMAMISEEARMQTALTRLEDVAEGVRRRAAESARLATAEADLLDQQRSETDQSATAITEMATTIQEVAHNVQHTSHAAEEARPTGPARA